MSVWSLRNTDKFCCDLDTIMGFCLPHVTGTDLAPAFYAFSGQRKNIFLLQRFSLTELCSALDSQLMKVLMGIQTPKSFPILSRERSHCAYWFAVRPRPNTAPHNPGIRNHPLPLFTHPSHTRLISGRICPDKNGRRLIFFTRVEKRSLELDCSSKRWNIKYKMKEESPFRTIDWKLFVDGCSDMLKLDSDDYAWTDS